MAFFPAFLAFSLVSLNLCLLSISRMAGARQAFSDRDPNQHRIQHRPPSTRLDKRHGEETIFQSEIRDRDAQKGKVSYTAVSNSCCPRLQPKEVKTGRRLKLRSQSPCLKGSAWLILVRQSTEPSISLVRAQKQQLHPGRASATVERVLATRRN